MDQVFNWVNYISMQILYTMLKANQIPDNFWDSLLCLSFRLNYFLK